MLLAGLTLSAAEPQPAEKAPATPRPYPEHLRWWAEARFGMFIHWGPVSLKGTEISWSRANTNTNCPNRGPIPAEVYDNLCIEVDLGQPKTFSRAVIRQAYPELRRVRKFAIEYHQNGQWKPCYQGVNLGARLAARFAPVTAQRVRLNLTDTTDGPTIWEFQLFENSKAGTRSE